MKSFDLLNKLLKIPAVSGSEFSFQKEQIKLNFPHFSEAKVDFVGNILLTRSGSGKNKKTILFEAHRDTIGFVIERIHEGGFASVVPIGGIDASLLPGTEFLVYGKSVYPAIATSLPPHLISKDSKSSEDKTENVFLDLPFETESEARQHIFVGNIVTFPQNAKKIENGCITSPYLDNFASVIALLSAYEHNANPYHDLLFLFSVGEETTSRGVRTFIGDTIPDVAFVFDAGFGYEFEMKKAGCVDMGMGVSVSFTDTLSRELESFVLSTAKREHIAIQSIAEPGGTGTSGTALQLLYGGLPSCLISIPVLNMHTPAEIVCESDIESATSLITALANEIELPCGEVIYV